MNGQSQSFVVKIVIFFLILTLAPQAGGFINAQEQETTLPNSYFINIDQATAAKGYNIKAFSDFFSLILPKEVLKEATGIEIKKIEDKLDLPWQLDKLSAVFQYELMSKSAYDSAKPLFIEIKFDRPSNYYKQIYFYDKNYSTWRPLNCKEITQVSAVRCAVPFSFARLAVFSNPNALVVGKASWYSYKKGNFAASPDFPKGSKLRVYNLENNKQVEVEINDFGPDRKLHPDRVIDLEQTAFKKIASLKQGTVKVRVEPLFVNHSGASLLGLTSLGAGHEPQVSAKSAVLINEQTKEILWQKNATSALPLASLTKLVAIKVFLDTRPSLNQVVTYSLKDEEYNYEYAREWESARLKLADGDTLTIEDLLYAALVGSANNAIETLVRVSGWSRPEFIAQMNKTVANWGASLTRFIEPTGLAPANVSSALDYAIIAKEAYNHLIIQKASTMPKYKFTTLKNKKTKTIVNTDRLLATSNLKITGSKTGYLDEAGYCLMARAMGKNGEQVIAVTLGAASRDQSFRETEELLKYGFKQISH